MAASATIVLVSAQAAPAAESIWAKGVQPPSTADSVTLSSGIQFVAQHRYEQAAKLFASVHDFDLLSYRATQSVLDAYVMSGEYDKALQTINYLQARETKGDKQTDYVRGITLKYKGDALTGKRKYDEAVSAYEAAAKLKPDGTYPILCLAGEILMKTHKDKEAIKVLDQAVADGCPNGLGYKHLGQCYMNLNQPAEAEKPLKLAISTMETIRKTKPDSFTIALISALKLLATSYKLQGKTALAASTQKRADSMASGWDQDLFGGPDPTIK